MTAYRFEGQVLAQKTLKSPIHCTGIGLHSGVKVCLTLHPAKPDTGIVFRRTDVDADVAEVQGNWRHVRDTRLCTVVGNDAGTTIGTVEHLMAALCGCGIDNVVVELDGPEVPIMDGSSAPFVFLIECAGIASQEAPKRMIKVLKRVEVADGGAHAVLEPAETTRFSFEIDFASKAVDHQEGAVDLVSGAFKRELSRARTFGFMKDVEWMRANGLARGGSLDNAIVINGDSILNREGLRYEDEFVRHKILDSVGDLYLAGAAIQGHFHGHRSGHALNHRLLTVLFADEDAWCLMPAMDEQPGYGTDLPAFAGAA